MRTMNLFERIPPLHIPVGNVSDVFRSEIAEHARRISAERPNAILFAEHGGKFVPRSSLPQEDVDFRMAFIRGCCG